MDLSRSSAVAIFAPDPYRSRNHGSDRAWTSRSSITSGEKTCVWQSIINVRNSGGPSSSHPRLTRPAARLHGYANHAGVPTADYQRLGELSIPNSPVLLPAYVHVPFCSRHCWYCDFNVYERMGRLIEPYCRALIREIEDTAQVLDGRVRVGCVYVGGGTPSLIGAKLLSEILDALCDRFGFERGSEATVEANPSNTTSSSLSALVEAGYDRLSVGAQSLSNERLAELDRLHSATEALEALDRAKAAGFRSVALPDDGYAPRPYDSARRLRRRVLRRLRGPARRAADPAATCAGTAWRSATRGRRSARRSSPSSITSTGARRSRSARRCWTARAGGTRPSRRPATGTPSAWS